MAPVVIVTGGNRGIGAATVRMAVGAGYAVCLSYRSHAEEANALAADLAAQGGRVLAVSADVANEADVARLFAQADSLGPLHALVNNAGILETQMQVADMDVARLTRVFAVNVIGSFVCAREAIHRLSTRRGGQGGSIVNVSSAASRLGAPGEYVDYAASKGAIDTFTLGLAKEVAAEGIRVNAVRPGLIETAIHASGGEPGRVNRLKSAIPLQRGGQPEEVAQAILWLLSDAASYCTGSLLDVSGGR